MNYAQVLATGAFMSADKAQEIIKQAMADLLYAHAEQRRDQLLGFEQKRADKLFGTVDSFLERSQTFRSVRFTEEIEQRSHGGLWCIY